MINVKEYIINNEAKAKYEFYKMYPNISNVSISEAYEAFGGVSLTLEVVEEDEEGHENQVALGGVSLKAKDVINMTEQEIRIRLIHNIALNNIRSPLTIIDNAKVYLHIDRKRYLLNDKFIPEQYYSSYWS